MLEPTPCPFCGTLPEILPSLSGPGFFVSCENGGCQVKPETTFPAATPEQAAERWNTRPTSLPQAA